MLKNCLILLLSALYFDQYGISNVEALIGFDVNQVRRNEFPFSVAFINLALQGGRDAQYFCGGTLISNKHVLTSAHCIQDESLSNIKVLIGSHVLLSPLMISYDISHCLTYEAWAKSKGLMHSVRDLAVVTLHTEVKNGLPITLSPIKLQHLEGVQVGMASWGMSMNGKVSMNMEKAYVRILHSQECLRKAYRYPSSIKNEIFQQIIMCSAADPAILGTLGNSGSPVFDRRKKELVGIHHGVCTKLSANDPEEANLLITIDSCRPFIRDAIK